MQLNRNVQSQYFSKDLIKAVYGIAIIMMMLHHLYDDPSLIVYTIIPNNPFIEEKISFLGKMCVGIYSFLAGTGAARVNEVELNRVVSLMLSRIKNLYKKYWFIFILFVPIGYFIDVYQFNGIELLTNFCALSSTYNGTWWFIYQYIMMLLFSPALLIVLDEATKDERSIIKILFFALTVIVGWIIVLRIGIYIETVYFILFILGMIFERNKLFDSAERKILEIPKKFKGGKTPIVGILFVLFMRLLIAKYTQFWYQMDIFLVPMFVFLLKPIILLNRKISSLLSFLGKHSTSIWLTHGFICDYFSVRYLYSLKYSVLIMIAFLLVAIILGVIVDEIFHWFCRVVNS